MATTTHEPSPRFLELCENRVRRAGRDTEESKGSEYRDFARLLARFHEITRQRDARLRDIEAVASPLYSHDFGGHFITAAANARRQIIELWRENMLWAAYSFGLIPHQGALIDPDSEREYAEGELGSLMLRYIPVAMLQAAGLDYPPAR